MWNEKRKLECKVEAYLVAGKILRSTEMKFEVAGSKIKFIIEKRNYAYREIQLWVATV